MGGGEHQVDQGALVGRFDLLDRRGELQRRGAVGGDDDRVGELRAELDDLGAGEPPGDRLRGQPQGCLLYTSPSPRD